MAAFEYRQAEEIRDTFARREVRYLFLGKSAAILLGFWLNFRQVRRLYRERPEWGPDYLFHVTGAVGFALFLLLFEGNFGHNLFRYSWLWYGGFLTIARYCIQQKLDAAEGNAWPDFSYVDPFRFQLSTDRTC